MFRFYIIRIRRRLLLGAGCVIVLSGLSLMVVHTGMVRRSALAQLQTRLGNTMGLVIDAKELDYNLLASRFELKDLAIKGLRTKDMLAPLKAQRVVAVIPVWNLLRGSFETAQIQIDGLSVNWLAATGGRNNWPAFESKGGGNSGGPSILVTSGLVNLQNDPIGYRMQIPIGKLTATWNQAKSAYAVFCESSGGQLQWNGSRLPLDHLQLTSSVANAGVALESLHLVSGDSTADIGGAMYGAPNRIEASASLNLSMPDLAKALLVKSRLGGRVQARLSAKGLLQALQINAELQGEQIIVDGVPIQRPMVVAVFDAATGEVRLRNLSAGFFSGQLKGDGKFSTTRQGPSEFNARLDGLNLREAARAFGRLEVPNRRASLEFHAVGSGLDWRRATVTGVANLQSAQVVFNATGLGDSVRASLDSTVGDARIIHGDVEFRPGDGAITGMVGGSVESLARLGHELEPLLDRPAGSLTGSGVDGAAEWSAVLRGTYQLPSASLQLQVHGLSVGGWTGAGLRVHANYDRDRIAIESAKLAWGGQKVEVKGEIGGLSADSSLNLNGTVEGQSLAGVSQNLGVTSPVEAALSGKVRIAGTLSRPEAEATLHAAELSVFGQPFSRASLEARWRDGELSVSRLAAEQQHASGAPGSVEAAGKLNTATGQYEMNAAAQNIQLSDVVLPGELPLSGTFQLKAHGKGALSDPALTAEITGAEVKAGSTPLGELHFNAEAAAHRATARLAIPSLNAKAESTIAMEGAWPFEVTLDARKAHLDTAPAATFDATARANGTLLQPHLERASAGIQDLKLETAGGEIRNDGPVELSYADGRVRVGQFALKSGSSTLRVSGDLPLEASEPAGAISFQGTVDVAPFAKLLPGSNESTIGGIVDVNASIKGTARNWQPEGSLTLREGRFQAKSVPLPFKDITGRLNLKEGMLSLDQFTGKAGAGTLQFSGTVPLGLISNALPNSGATAGQPARFSAQMEKLHLTDGRAEQASTMTVDAKLEGEASALTMAALHATVELTNVEIKAANSELQQATPVRITIADGVARLENLDLRGGNSWLKASGSLGLTGSFPLQLAASGETDLGLIAALESSPGAAGTLRLDVNVSGTLSEPQTAGYIELKNASLSLENPPLQGSNINLRADLEGHRATIKQLDGNLNGGRFQGGGDLSWGANGLRDVNLSLTAKDMFSEFPTAVKTISAVDLKLLSRGDRLVLEGRIDVQEGYYESTLDLFSRSAPSPETGAEDLPGASAKPLELDIKIVTKRPVEMNNNLGRLSAMADLRLGGNINQPRLTGNLKLEDDGRLYFGDRTYDIERGTVRFLDAPHITPELNIQASTRANDYTIYLGITGGLDELTTTFTSDPPLSRDDVIAILLTGKTVAENKGVDLRALEANALATGALNASLSSQMHRTFGVSRVSIQPGAAAAESNPGARVTVTQDFTRTFRLMYSTNLSDSNDQIWVTEYDISRRFTTRAVKQHDNTYRGEFRHDIRFGGSSGAASAASSHTAKQKISAVHFTDIGPFSQEQLAKVFKIKTGQKYDAAKVRKGSDRLSKFFTKQGYLESRVRMDREEDGQGIGLTVRIELGPVVELAFEGVNLPGKQKARLRSVWHSGISDQQRQQTTKEAILGYFADEGYLRAKADVRISGDANRKVAQFHLERGALYKGVKIIVEGADPGRAAEIVSLIRQRGLKQSVYRDSARVIKAVTGYYTQRGYLTAKVSRPVHQLDAERRTGRIVIPVQEGPLFHVGALQFSGNQVLTAAALESGLPLEPGAVFEPSRLEPTLAAVKLKYGKLGYREADIEYVTTRHDDRASVDVSFKVVENQQTSISAIKVEGNRHTSEKFARRHIKVAEGEVANTELVRESVKNLAQTGAYTSADIQVKPIVDPGVGEKPIKVAELVVGVAEPKPFRLLYGGLYDSGNGPGFIADFQNRNSLGAGRVLGLRTRADSDTEEVRLYLTQPTLRSHRLSTTLGTYYTRETEDYQTTPTEKLGLSIQQDVQLPSKLLLSYGYRYEKQRGFVPDPAAPYIPESIVAVAPVTLTITRDARDSFLDATRGHFASNGFEFAPGFLGSDYPYLRYYGQYFKYFPFTRPRPVPYGEKLQPSRLVFATGSRIGLQKGFNSTGAVLTDRFYSGGGTTVRGFRQDELGPKLSTGQPAGGNAVLVLNEELRFPLYKFFDAVTFVDIGNVFPRVGDFKLSDLRSAGGFGLRIRNPFVVLRFDYGFKFGRRPGETIGAFFFSIGQAF